jgi:hypothetical protein
MTLLFALRSSTDLGVHESVLLCEDFSLGSNRNRSERFSRGRLVVGETFRTRNRFVDGVLVRRVRGSDGFVLDGTENRVGLLGLELAG